MATLEQRVERLERSSRRWRAGCIATIIISASAFLFGADAKPAVPAPAAPAPVAPVPAAAAAPAQLPNGDFDHLTAADLTIGTAGGPALTVLSDKNQTSLSITDAKLSTSAVLVVSKDGANVLLSKQTPKGMTRASLGVDDQSGTIDVKDVTGKTKEIEPD
jgi:hypothetical protein